MKKQKIYLAVLLILAGCYSPTANLYNSEKTEGVDYKKYKTYAWLPTKDTAYTQLVERQRVAAALAYAVREQLTERGMTMDTLNPDCLFTYTLVLKKTYDVGQQPNPVYAPQSNAGLIPGQYNSFYYYTPGAPSYDLNYNPDLYQGGLKVTTFRDGSLVIDMIDRASKQIVWRTSAQGKVEEKDRQGVRPTINEIVPKMFKKFPVKQN